MQLPDLFDALDKLSGFDRGPNGELLEPYPAQLTDAINAMPEEARAPFLAEWRKQAISAIQAMPINERQVFIAEWTRQRFTRAVQLETVEGTGEDAAEAALRQLESCGIELGGDA